MTDQKFEKYHTYLLKRSRLSWLYRRWYLYPSLAKYLKGEVLDIGCGIGDFLSFWRNAIGVDVNPYNVSYCQSRGLKAIHVDFLPYPFEDQSFDGVVLDNVLEHIENPRPILKEIRRVLKKNDFFIVGVPGNRGYASDPDHKIFYDEKRLVNLLQDYGFKKKKILHMPLKSRFLNDQISQYCLYGIFS